MQPWRRIFHAGSGLLVALLPGFLGMGRLPLLAGLFLGLLLLAAVDALRLRSPALNARFFALFPSLASPREVARPASSTWYALGVLVVYAAFPWRLAVPAILVLALADPAASVLGRLMRGHRLGKGTVEGSLVFLAVAWLVLSPTAGWPGAVVVAAGVSLVEVLPWRLDDNLSIPVAAAALLWLVGV